MNRANMVTSEVCRFVNEMTDLKIEKFRIDLVILQRSVRYCHQKKEDRIMSWKATGHQLGLSEESSS